METLFYLFLLLTYLTCPPQTEAKFYEHHWEPPEEFPWGISEEEETDPLHEEITSEIDLSEPYYPYSYNLHALAEQMKKIR